MKETRNERIKKKKERRLMRSRSFSSNGKCTKPFWNIMHTVVGELVCSHVESADWQNIKTWYDRKMFAY